jgi:hypothetical protein
MKVNNKTRATYKGREISCPHCETINTVYHFGWSAVQCDKCKLMVDKKEWDLVDKKQIDVTIDEEEFLKFKKNIKLMNLINKNKLSPHSLEIFHLMLFELYTKSRNKIFKKTKKIKKSKKVKI